MVNYFAVKVWEWLEDRSFYKVFGDAKFRKIDRELQKAYFWKNPYTLSREFYEAIGETNVHQYGETPLTTMSKIARALKLGPEDHVYEYGAGRGRASFFLSHFTNAKISAVEHNPLFIRRARRIAEKFDLSIEFLEKDFLDITPDGATVIYLYGTCLSDRMIYDLCDKFNKGVKVVTISYALCEYDKRFSVKQKLRVRFPWGETEAYINQ